MSMVNSSLVRIVLWASWLGVDKTILVYTFLGQGPNFGEVDGESLS